MGTMGKLWNKTREEIVSTLRTLDIPVYRTEYLDQDNNRRSKTDLSCIACGKDLDPSKRHRMVHMVDGGPFVLHPEDEKLYPKNDPGDLGCWPIGSDCARKLGLEWSVAP